MKVIPSTSGKMEQRHRDYLDKIDELTSNNYFTRGVIMEQLPPPESKSNLIIIPSNAKGAGFLRDCYDEFFLAGLIHKQEFDQIINTVNKIMGNLFSKKRRADKETTPWYQINMIILSAIIMLAFLIMAFYIPKYGMAYTIVTFSLCLISMLLIITVTIINVIGVEPQIVAFEDMVQEEVPEYLEALNISKFANKGMEWYLMPGHYWLELRINPLATPQDVPNFQSEGTDRADNLQTEERLRTALNEETKERMITDKSRDQDRYGDLTKILEDISIEPKLEKKTDSKNYSKNDSKMFSHNYDHDE
ncbi:unnamed protein product [Moneuplotes crassus]|uniref:Uncharacterized protein n=1 Tax=Euplotes crassus TaxID=5936 RepID=A0AAD1X8P8_EUPCR|nr:unnamed protein product [Moneuplotes crassus]